MLRAKKKGNRSSGDLLNEVETKVRPIALTFKLIL